MIKFGDVFRYREELYVFLAKTDDVVFAAQIIDEDKVASINSHMAKISSHDSRRFENILYCFVTLETDMFKGQGAHLNKAQGGSNELNFDELISNLEKVDLKKIKEEINKGPLPKILKDLVKNIEI